MTGPNDMINENLVAQVATEPRSKAAQEARKLGLSYIGFGRYADAQGKTAYVVQNDRLVPYKSPEEVSKIVNKAMTSKDAVQKKQEMADAKRYVSADRQVQRNDMKVQKDLDKEVLAVAKQLAKLYPTNTFDEEEVAAIQDYTSASFFYVNRYLYKGFDPDTTSDMAQHITDTISKMDAAFEDTQAPFDYITYTGLSGRYDANKIKPGENYIFKGYVSSSLSHRVAIDGFVEAGQNQLGVVLQINVAKGQKAIYVDPLSINDGEMETILPRGTMLQVLSGPHVVDAGMVSEQQGQIAIFECQILEES